MFGIEHKTFKRYQLPLAQQNRIAIYVHSGKVVQLRTIGRVRRRLPVFESALLDQQIDSGL